MLASRDSVVRAARLAAGLAAVALALPALAACSSANDAAPRRTTSSSPEEVLSGLAGKGVAALFTGTYRLDSIDPKQADAKVTIYRLDSSYRVDVARKGATSILMTTKDGLVSCQAQGSRRTCLLVGDSAKPPPKLFDPGLQRLFTTDLGALAAGSGITVTPAGVLPAAATIGSATCYRVSGTGVDPGGYCLTDAGILRRAQFPSGTLELTALSGPPAASAFTPPVKPTPLPS